MPMLRALAVAIALATLPSSAARAAPLFDFPVHAVQPDGQAVDLLASGDEYRHRLHDVAGFTVVRDPVTGWWVYADSVDGRLVPTGLPACASDPGALAILPGLLPPAPPSTAGQRPRHLPGVRGAPLTGTLNNIVVFVRFAGEAEFTDAIADYQRMFNDPEPGGVSLYGYYLEATYGKLEIRSTFYPAPTGDAVVSFEDSHTRRYYQPYNATANPDGYHDSIDSMSRESDLIAAAATAIAPQIPDGLALDGDGDGFIDNMVFIVDGAPDGWSDLLWPHQTMIYQLVEIRGLKVLYYNFQLSKVLKSGSEVGVLAHEMFHTLGAPDLYHYSQDGLVPAGPWDLMEHDGAVPQHMSAQMKHEYGHWIDTIPEIKASGSYELKPLASPTGNAWRVAAKGSATQSFVIEYRRAVGTYEKGLPGSGLLVWRVDAALALQGNKDGPPDEIYVFRPGGSTVKTGQVEQAFLAPGAGRGRFAEDTDPHPYLSDGTPVPFRIWDISEPGDTITFKVCVDPPECLGRECGDDGCGGSCGACAGGKTCGDGLCGGDLGVAGWRACLSTCSDDACRTACDAGLSGEGRRLVAALDHCLANRCAGLAAAALDSCRDARCAAQRDACLAGDGTAKCEDVAACVVACADVACADACRAGVSAAVLATLREACGSGCEKCGDGTRCDAGNCVPCEGASCAGACEPACPAGACGDDGCAGECPACAPAATPCQRAFCDAGACATWPAKDGWPCDDGTSCTLYDRCTAGACGGTAIQCPKADFCHDAGACDPATGACASQPAKAGTQCNDHDICTSGDACDGTGGCAGTAYTCTPDPCDASVACDGSGGCKRTSVAAGTPCDDGDPATEGTICDKGGYCVLPAPEPIEPGPELLDAAENGAADAVVADAADGLPAAKHGGGGCDAAGDAVPAWWIVLAAVVVARYRYGTPW